MLLHSDWYTSVCTMNEQSLLTLSDWQRACLAGAQPRALLEARAQRLAARAAAPDWIHRVSSAQLEQQIQALEARLAAASSRASLLNEAPLFGVPFAVKDNIDVEGMPTTVSPPRLRLHGRAQRPRGAASAERRRRLPGQDQSRPVRHRPRRRALALWAAGLLL